MTGILYRPIPPPSKWARSYQTGSAGRGLGFHWTFCGCVPVVHGSHKSKQNRDSSRDARSERPQAEIGTDEMGRFVTQFPAGRAQKPTSQPSQRPRLGGACKLDMEDSCKHLTWEINKQFAYLGLPAMALMPNICNRAKERVLPRFELLRLVRALARAGVVRVVRRAALWSSPRKNRNHKKTIDVAGLLAHSVARA